MSFYPHIAATGPVLRTGARRWLGALLTVALSVAGLRAQVPGKAQLNVVHPLPPYAPAFLLARYEDPNYRQLVEHWPDEGQL